ncbi:MAG TPA: deoxynucleoside kinase [Chloroflexi bacterium]|nr:deoxynucleoside kinase [Chloroflexota bacterium]
MKKRFVAIAGNIGVGKSTLTKMLSERLGWEPFYEAADDNPYLSDLYQDMQRWCFHSEVFFLARKVFHYHQILERPNSVIQDRTIYEDAEIFVENFRREGLMSERDYRTYRLLYEVVIELLPPPDLVIYLQASVPTLEKRIALRGRDYEKSMDRGYLEKLNKLYEEWIERYSLSPVLKVPADRLDFVKFRRHMDLIVEKVMEKLQGKEVVTFDGDLP